MVVWASEGCPMLLAVSELKKKKKKKKKGKLKRNTSRSVEGGLDLLVFLSLVEHCYFLRKIEGENAADRGSREIRNKYLIHLRMNSCSLSWTSYCSSAWAVRPNGEAAVSCFGEFFAQIWLFIRFGSTGVSALMENRQAHQARIRETSLLHTSCQITNK